MFIRCYWLREFQHIGVQVSSIFWSTTRQLCCWGLYTVADNGYVYTEQSCRVMQLFWWDISVPVCVNSMVHTFVKMAVLRIHRMCIHTHPHCYNSHSPDKLRIDRYPLIILTWGFGAKFMGQMHCLVPTSRNWCWTSSFLHSLWLLRGKENYSILHWLSVASAYSHDLHRMPKSLKQQKLLSYQKG